MPSPTRTLTERTARRLIGDWSFPEVTKERVGVELEWFTTPSARPPDVPTLRSVLDVLSRLPYGSAITFEPGGQVELSSVPFEACSEACVAIAADSEVVRRVLAQHGIDVFASGFDPDRTLDLRTSEPRYTAMRTYFDRYGVWGGRMMCASAAIHVNLDAGADDEGIRRWRAANLIGPTLIAAFANSPIVEAGPSGWKSSRVAAWLNIDRTRTHDVYHDGDPRAAWASYALNAHTMLIRTPDGFVPIDGTLRFVDWLNDGHELGFPEADDLAYHLTTLFPPVRPHGYLEVRMIDMLPDPWWRVAVAVTTALVCDPEARHVAGAVCERSSHLWTDAARFGLEDSVLHDSARACFEASLGALDRVGCEPSTTSDLLDYIERFIEPGRCPADEQLQELAPSAATKEVHHV